MSEKSLAELANKMRMRFAQSSLSHADGPLIIVSNEANKGETGS